MQKQSINEITWVIGGAQGSGVDSAANIFSRACAESGLYIFGKREFYSNIKGEHSYFTVRASNKLIRSSVDSIEILVSFDAETLFRHANMVSNNGLIIFDSNIINTTINDIYTMSYEEQHKIKKILNKFDKDVSIQDVLDFVEKNNKVKLCGIPYNQLLKEFSEQIGKPSLSKLARMINVIAVSISLSILGCNLEHLRNAIKYIFKTKSNIIEINLKAADFAYNYAKKMNVSSLHIPKKNRHEKDKHELILILGSQASALGKIIAGCRFQTYYPITPASEDSELLESNQIIHQIDGKKGSVVVMQTEDEISAITMAIGGALTGVRTSTATSGPGFSLMAEALGWSGINEVPLVVSLYQRAGPSTGLPTRHEQGDLLFAIHAGHGEFPRIVFASGDIEESFYDTIKVFNFAEIYQVPVIHMLDKAISSSIITCRKFDTKEVKIERGKFLKRISKKNPSFKRFKLSNDPISYRTSIGTKDGIFWHTGDEHDEEGHITEDPEMRTNMMNKRMNKLLVALEKIPEEDKASSYYPNSEIVIISWGSTKGAILDALYHLRHNGIKIGFIQIRLLNPFPTKTIKKMINNAKTLITIEMNYSSQLSQLIKQNLKTEIDYEIVKYNGRPISMNEIYDVLKSISIDKHQLNRRIVLKNGI
ncbi:MAG: 2-oxoacid:ferredoxin oxidoreductase subunit alpha [Nitrososphaeraceae archaeon]